MLTTEKQSVWEQIKHRTIKTARTLEKHDYAGRASKRLKSVSGSEVPRASISYKGNVGDDELLALLGHGVDVEAGEAD